MIFSLFSNFDIFRIPVFFYFEGKSKLSTHMGIACSVSIYIFLLVNLIKSDFFEKKNPIIVSQSLQMPRAEIISFDPHILLTFSVSDASHNSYIDPTIFKVQFKYYHVRSNGLGATDILSLEYRDLHACSKEDFAFNYSVYDILGLKNSLCLDNKSFDIYGFWDEPELKYVSVNLIPCDNYTDNVTCKSPDEINHFFTSPYKFFTVSYHNVQIDFYNYENPINIVYKVDYQLVDLAIMKRFNIFLKNSSVTTDDGWIFPNENIKKDIMYASKDNDFQSRNTWGSPTFQILMYASKEKMIVTRRYQKLPEVLGSLAGMAQAIIIFCFIFTRVFARVKTLRHVLNELYYFPNEKRIENTIKYSIGRVSKMKSPISKIEKERISPRKNNKNYDLEKSDKDLNLVYTGTKQPQKNLAEDSFVLENYSKESPKVSEIALDQKLPNSFFSPNFPSSNNKELPSSRKKIPFLTKIKEIFIPNKNTSNNGRLRLSFLEYSCYFIKQMFCFKPNEKESIIKKAEKAFKSEMDILTILSRLHEINQLKLVLFNNDQLFLFNHIRKPLISLNEAVPTDNLEYSARLSLAREKSSKNISHFKECYKRILNCRENNEINRRLIEYFDERNFFNSQ